MVGNEAINKQVNYILSTLLRTLPSSVDEWRLLLTNLRSRASLSISFGKQHSKHSPSTDRPNNLYFTGFLIISTKKGNKIKI